ncbi:toxin ParE1/3/4 [Rhizobium aquaticum]|uniref:Toxin ParE1/3/4 n=1 Tax=Rhizobium aquaticum TaxID=1549636 RepID=A0ABV2IVJ5_9HYPH
MSERYKISRKAQIQISGIVSYTAEMFGPYQAKAYHSGLARTFELLSDFPLMGPMAQDLFPGLRQFTFQAHIIFYTTSEAGVFIRQVLNHRVNLRPELFR